MADWEDAATVSGGWEDAPSSAPQWEDAKEQANWADVPSIMGGQAADVMQKGSVFAGMGASKFIEDALAGISAGHIKFNPIIELVKKAKGFATDEEAANYVYGNMEATSKLIQEQTNPSKRELSFPQQAAGMVATFPAQVAAMPFQAAEKGKTLVDLGETNTGNIQTAVGIDAALNAASIALPAAARGGMLTRAATGGAANAVLGGASDQFTKDLAETGAAKKAFDPFSEEGLKRMALQGVVGAGLGVATGTRATPSGKPTGNITARLDALDKAKEEQKLTQGEGTLYVGKDGDVTTDLPGLVKETPEQVDIARTELQRQLEEKATRNVEGQQLELIDESGNVIQRQQELGLQPRVETVAPLKSSPKEDVAIRERNEAREKERQGWLDLGNDAFKRARNAKSDRAREQAMSEFTMYADKAEAIKNQMEKETPLVSDTGSIFAPDESGSVNRLVDIQKLPSYDKETGEFNPIEYLTNIRDSHVEGKNRAYKAIYDLVLKAFSKMPEGRIPRFALDIDPTTKKPRDKTYDRTGNMGRDSAGQYDPNTDVVWLGRRGETEGTLVHETIHALTSRVLYLYKPTDVRVRGLYKIYESVINDPAFKNQYGTLDIHEFLAETFSSPTFQARLAQHQLKGIATVARNALNAVVKEIVSVLGYKSHSPENRIFTNALEEIVFNTEKLVDLYAENKKSFDEMWLDKVPASVNVESIPTRTSRSIDAITNNSISTAKAAAKAQLSDPDTAKTAQIEKVSGELYVSKDPVVDEALINKIKGEADGSGTWALTPGALGRSELANSTLVKTVYRFMNNAFKRAEYKINQVVKPTQETFTKLMRSPQKAAMSHEILMREMRRGEDYTTEELRGIGVPDDLIKAHLEFRSMMQQALEAQNMALRDKGLPPVKGIDAYISSRWSGPWRANIKDAEGNIIWQVAEHSKKKAQDALEWIKTKQPGLTIEDPIYRKGFEKGDDVEAGYLDMLKALDKEDPRVAVLESIYKDYLTGNTENVASQEKHFLRKKGVRGFAGDRPWSENDVWDFFVQQFAYAENAFKWSESQKGVEGVKKLVNDPTLQETQKNNIQFSKEYAKGQLGFGTSETFSAIDNGLAKLTGLSPQKLQEYMGAAKTFFYLTKLGLSVPFTITQFLQPAITTPAWHSKLDSTGYKHNPIVTTLKSITGGASAALWHYGQYFNSPELSKAAELGMSKLDMEAARYMESNGVIDINPMTDIKKGLRPAAVKAIAAPFEFTIKHSEIIARSNAFMGFVSHLQQSGKYKTSSAKGRMELFQKAEDMTNLSMTDYRSQERAMVFEKMGLTGDAAATLHTYQINNLMQLLKFSKEAANGNVMPLFYMVGMQAMAAGLTGLWFVEDLDDLLNNLKKLLPHDQFMKVKDFSLKNFILTNAGDVAGYGLVSKITGTNIHTRMNASNQIPIWPFESQEDPIKNAVGIAPFVESLYDTGMGAVQAVAPGSTPQERMQGLYAAAPTVAQGPMERLPAFSDAGVSLKPRNLGQGKIRRTEEEKDLRDLGLKSTREQKQADREFGLSKIERQIEDRINTASKKAIEFAISGEGKNAAEQMIRYVELGGDAQTLVARIPQAKLSRVTTELQRRAIGASKGTRASVLKLQRYINQVTQ